MTPDQYRFEDSKIRRENAIVEVFEWVREREENFTSCIARRSPFLPADVNIPYGLDVDFVIETLEGKGWKIRRLSSDDKNFIRIE